MGKLTRDERRVLRSLEKDDEALDWADLRDRLGFTVDRTFAVCQTLRDRGLIHMVYWDDQASITPAGRTALRQQREAGSE